MELEYKDLERLTAKFKPKNLIQHAHFSKLYRGRIPQGWKGLEPRIITVKVWTDKLSSSTVRPPHSISSNTRRSWDQNLENFRNEIAILEYHGAEFSPCLPKLLGFCREDTTQRLGVVYDLESFNVLANLVDKERLRWHHRIKAFLGVAKLLEHFHGNQPPYFIRDLSASDIMFGRGHSTVLINFFGITGGVIGDKIQGNDIIMDPESVQSETWTEDMGVYSFGILLLELIRKRKVSIMEESSAVAFDSLDVLKKVHDQRKSSELFRASTCSLADYSFEFYDCFQVSDSATISELAMQCITMPPGKRPNAKEIVEKLNELCIVKNPPRYWNGTQYANNSSEKNSTANNSETCWPFFCCS